MTSTGPGMVRVLVVCMGNICRSPMAHAIGLQLARTRQVAFQFDSAGTHAMVGSAIDARARATLKQHGYEPAPHRTRQLAPKDFERFDLLLAMDRQNLAELRRLAPPEHVGKLRLLSAFVPDTADPDVPDPYYGPATGFERAFTLCEAGIRGLMFGPQAFTGS